MDTFLRANAIFLGWVTWMVLGILSLSYTSFYLFTKASQENLKIINSHLNTEQHWLNGLNKREKNTKIEQKNGVSEIALFLQRINTIAQNNKLIIQKLTPNDQWSYNIEFKTDYNTFLLFMAQLESLDIQIDNMEIRPYDVAHKPPIHLVTFVITPHNNAQELTDQRLNKLSNKVSNKNKRNPFQRLAYNKKNKTFVVPDIDLTWIYKLSGISRQGNKRYATINRKDYYVGDKLGVKIITAIESDRVFLTENTKNYVLKFRKRKVK